MNCSEGQSHGRIVEDMQARLDKLAGSEASLQSEVMRVVVGVRV